MTRRIAKLALAACALLGCGGPPAPTVVQPEPEPAQCENYRLPVYYRFPCHEATFDLDFARNWERFRGLSQWLQTRPGLRRVILRGTVSANGTTEIDHPELAAQRARSVAEALVREGLPRAMVEVDERVGPETAAYNEPDGCPPRAEDEHGDRRRAVLVNMVLCER